MRFDYNRNGEVWTAGERNPVDGSTLDRPRRGDRSLGAGQGHGAGAAGHSGGSVHVFAHLMDDYSFEGDALPTGEERERAVSAGVSQGDAPGRGGGGYRAVPVGATRDGIRFRL